MGDGSESSTEGMVVIPVEVDKSGCDGTKSLGGKSECLKAFSFTVFNRNVLCSADVTRLSK